MTPPSTLMEHSPLVVFVNDFVYAFFMVEGYCFSVMEKGQPLPKFGEWDVNDLTSAEGFTVIFNKARDEKKTGGKPESTAKADSNIKHGADPVKPQAVN
ncbi:hypothetical protein F0562_011229 [Nyssa sinensis]|uniref:RIN4 pathogenic type III effector avirulence factor Avr cleavage site domain-containing protein n=1 Tax=Nyssa sinensis TaxID=561372 RepID=A0A5J5A422_9ASTE|nr:hypothetical protein F0562_011229 [Nyssa sinensis]